MSSASPVTTDLSDDSDSSLHEGLGDRSGRFPKKTRRGTLSEISVTRHTMNAAESIHPETSQSLTFTGDLSIFAQVYKGVIMEEKEVGTVSDYFAHIGVVAVEISKGELQVGDTLHFKGHTTDFTETIQSMQIEHEQVDKAKVGDSIGIKVKERVRKHDSVYKVIE